MRIGDRRNPDSKVNENIQFGGKKIFVTRYFANSKLISVSLIFDAGDFGDIVEVFTSKFGSPPHRTRNEQVITRMGVGYTNTIVEWDTDSGVFVIMRYGSEVDSGWAHLNSPQLAASEQLERKARQEELKKSL